MRFQSRRWALFGKQVGGGLYKTHGMRVRCSIGGDDGYLYLLASRVRGNFQFNFDLRVTHLIGQLRLWDIGLSLGLDLRVKLRAIGPGFYTRGIRQSFAANGERGS